MFFHSSLSDSPPPAKKFDFLDVAYTALYDGSTKAAEKDETRIRVLDLHLRGKKFSSK